MLYTPWGMFFIFKKKNYINNPDYGMYLSKYNLSGKSKFLVITTDISIINTMLIPIYYTLKNRDVFMLLYRFSSLRNFDKLRLDLKRFRKKSEYQTILIPSKNMKPLLRIFFLFKIAFHFPGSVYQGERLLRSEVIFGLKCVYGFLRLNYFKKLIWSFS